jgi:hypothetical protein
VTGDDADDLINKFAKRFNVRPGTHCLLRTGGVKDYKTKELITVGMLQRAIELGVCDSQRFRETQNARPEP